MGLRSSLNGFLRSPLALTFTPESALPEENKENWLSSERDRLKANGEDVKRQRAGGGEAHGAFLETERRRWRCFLEFFSITANSLYLGQVAELEFILCGRMGRRGCRLLLIVSVCSLYFTNSQFARHPDCHRYSRLRRLVDTLR